MTQLTIKNNITDYRNKYNNGANQQNKQQSFKGVGDIVTAGLQMCDQYPMVGVSVVDLSSTIVPRTIVDAKTGIPAAAETFRRESSGLVVNCLTPSLFVLGASKLLNKSIFKDFKGVDMTGCWANEDTINKLADVYKQADKNVSAMYDRPEDVPAGKKAEEFVRNVFSKLEGFDEKGYVPLFNAKTGEGIDHVKAKAEAKELYESSVKQIADLITDPSKNSKKTIDSVVKKIADHSKAIETIRFGTEGAFTSNLSDLLRDQVTLGRQFAKKEVFDNLGNFQKAAIKMVNSKSILGMSIILPLAMSMQSINRAITRKIYHQKGAPIYKDFGKGQTQKEMTPKEKNELFIGKCAAAAGMVGLAVTSMMKKPSMKMFQFKGMFPTTDQCRWIATATIASRFFAAEDKNELRESVIRDASCFAGLYFLGDYVAKGVASLVEHTHKDVKLINKLVADDKTKSAPGRLWNWVKNYKLKSFDEVKGPGAKNWRSLCQVANIGFAIVALGVALPIYNRHLTNKKLQKQKEQEAATNTTKMTSTSNYFAKNTPKAFGKIAQQSA